MDFSASSGSRSPFSAGHQSTNDFSSPGFGAVMEQEHVLRSSTSGFLDSAPGRQETAIDRILRTQQIQLGANIALLEQRYEMPAPAAAADRAREPHASSMPVTPASVDRLSALVSHHVKVLGQIDTLLAAGGDGQRGGLILAQVAHNHEEMAWTLTTLLKENESVRDATPVPVIAGTAATALEAT
jgi:hypothetical protein